MSPSSQRVQSLVLAVSLGGHGRWLRWGGMQGTPVLPGTVPGKARYVWSVVFKRLGGSTSGAATRGGCCSDKQAGMGAASTLGLGCLAVATPKGAGDHPPSPKCFPPAPPQAAAGCMKPLCKISIKAPTHPKGTDRQQRGTGVTQREAEVLARAAAAQRRGTGTPFCP